MRYLRLVTAALVVLSAGASFAQGWHEYVSREEFFLVNMPAMPQIATTTYRAASGAVLPAKTFIATEGQRRYSVTVVHYMNASAADVDRAIAHAVQSFRDRPGQVTYDREQLVEGLPAHMIYVLNPDQSRTAAGIILHAGTNHGGPGRLYILEGTVPAGAAPPIQFPQSFFLLDEAGGRLDYVTNAAGQRVRNVRTQVTNISAPYGAREPVTCESRAEPTQGKPTAAQAAQYVSCTLEGIGDGTLFLLENVQVREIGEARLEDARYFPDIAAGQPAFPIRGSLVRYACEREGRNTPTGRADPGANCASYLEANASGHCYKTTAGTWSCSMSDLVPRERTEGVAPPR